MPCFSCRAGLLSILVGVVFPAADVCRTTAAEMSTPPIVRLPEAENRPRGEGPAKFVDSEKGDDSADGSEAKPWRSIGHALASIVAGDTLYLRGGVFYENVRVAVSGRADAPITIRSFPGELATIDAGYPEFARTPTDAWEPV